MLKAYPITEECRACLPGLSQDFLRSILQYIASSGASAYTVTVLYSMLLGRCTMHSAKCI
ncbi:hypothetical protein BD410DRAFT_793624 [Rickenella mellea]|uniref:Uncharacterized protein n=1 Tax=Rickenella mellea TaxID=50990 RepID=A0A4Y7PUA8_9AGAM|nr:hypothetical protein BD410DRAFT_793624 [Rickenella mellea]